MSTQHNAILSLPEFWRSLAIVVIGFAVVLVLSFTIDTAFPREPQNAVANAQSENAA
jgi:anti-sigma-K factor RskA